MPELLEAEVVVDPGEAGAARGAVRIEQQARAIDRAVVVELDRLLQVLAAPRPAGSRSAAGSPRRGRPWDRAGRAPWRSRTARSASVVALLLEVGLAEIGAQQRVVGVQADRDLEVLAPLLEVALADLGEAEAEARQRDRRASSAIARSNAALAGAGAELDQVGEAEHDLGALEVGRERHRPLRRLARALAVAEHQPQLGRAAPRRARRRGCCSTACSSVSRAASSWKLRLLGVGQRDLGRARLGAQLDRALRASASACSCSFCTSSMIARWA